MFALRKKNMLAINMVRIIGVKSKLKSSLSFIEYWKIAMVCGVFATISLYPGKIKGNKVNVMPGVNEYKKAFSPNLYLVLLIKNKIIKGKISNPLNLIEIEIPNRNPANLKFSLLRNKSAANNNADGIKSNCPCM